MTNPRKNTIHDVWSRIQIGDADECWPWLGAISDGRYGIISIDCVDTPTHRAAWESVNGPIPAGLFILHRCDNPPCCNPGHLFLGTLSDNTADMHSKGRWPSRKGSLHPLAKLTEEQALEIRRRRNAGERNMTLAAEFKVSRSRITSIANGSGWQI